VRILFAFPGGTGHFLPLEPLARAAAGAGHEVLVAAQAGMLEVVREAGFAAADTGGATLRPPNVRTELLPLDAEREREVVRRAFAGTIATERERRTGELIREWRPGLVVCDEADLGVAAAAQEAGVPTAVVASCVSGTFLTDDLYPERLARSRYGDLYLVAAPPSFRHSEAPLPPGARCFRTDRDESAPPAWLAALEPPLVYATLGTIFNLESGDLFERLLTGLARVRASAVLTVGRELEPAALGEPPPNVRVERFVPQAALLARAAAAVTHGGSGSVVGALAHGVPVVVLPLGADQPDNAERVEALGAGVVLDAAAASADRIAAAVEAVLAEPAYRAAAERLRDETAALPGPGEALGWLEALAEA
jgi:UDP:flavonoid glycosyltransferase YjiC (YdhE family)